VYYDDTDVCKVQSKLRALQSRRALWLRPSACRDDSSGWVRTGRPEGCLCRESIWSVAYAKVKRMATETAKPGRPGPVIQFSVFTPNRLGRLHDLIGLLGTHDIHVLALMVLDTTESSIVRLVVDDPDRARDLLAREAFCFTESRLVVVEVDPTGLQRLMAALLEAELNINYLYSFIPHPQGRSILALSMEDNDLAEQSLGRHQFRTLRQADVSR
jgi:hypothetical protein